MTDDAAESARDALTCRAAALTANGYEAAFWRVDVAEKGALKAEDGKGRDRIGAPRRPYGRAGRHRLGIGLAGVGRGDVRHRGRDGDRRRLYGVVT